MSGYLNYLQTKAHDAEIGERAERSRPAFPPSELPDYAEVRASIADT